VYKEVRVLNIWRNKISDGAGVLKIWGKKLEQAWPQKICCAPITSVKFGTSPNIYGNQKKNLISCFKKKITIFFLFIYVYIYKLFL
jgi:hypothetical protein